MASSIYTPEYYATLVEIQRKRNAEVDAAIGGKIADLMGRLFFWDDYLTALEEDFG